jgi:putative membrane protein
MSVRDRLDTALFALVAAALIASGIAPYDRATWLMEVAPVLIVLPVLMALRHRHPPTTLLLVLVAVHALVLIGAAPGPTPGSRSASGCRTCSAQRANPTTRRALHCRASCRVAAREIQLRGGHVRRGRMAAFLSSASGGDQRRYELVRKGRARRSARAPQFLRTQGDDWDTQSDMQMALIGASTALALLGRLHDRQSPVFEPCRGVDRGGGSHAQPLPDRLASAACSSCRRGFFDPRVFSKRGRGSSRTALGGIGGGSIAVRAAL